jgi:O-antigen/teichoic acid export membrane protein
MIRKILSFALIALVALVVFKVALGLLGVLIGLTVTVCVLAAMGYGLYLILRVFSPSTAERIRQMIRGTPTTTP